MFTRQELESLSRKELQKLAKDNQIRANEKSSVIIDSLLALSGTLDSGFIPEAEAALPEQGVLEEIQSESLQLPSVRLSPAELVPSVESCIQGIQSLDLKMEEPNHRFASEQPTKPMEAVDSLAVHKAQPIEPGTNSEVIAVVGDDKSEELGCMQDSQDGEFHVQGASDNEEEEYDEEEEHLPTNEAGDGQAADKEVVVAEYRHAKLSKTSAKKVRDFLRFKNDIKMGVYRTKPRDPDYIPHNTAPKTKAHGTKVLDTKENHGHNALVTKPLET